jgi:hypothetical protein
MTLLRTTLPQFNNLEIVQKNVGGGHRYYVEGFPMRHLLYVPSQAP